MTDLNNLERPKSKQTMPDSGKVVFKGEIFTVYQWPQTMYDGTTATFEKLSREDTVGVVAVTDDNKIIITEQQQPSIQPFLSLLGGVVDKGETPFETAQRELLEEAGGVAVDWKLWFSTQPVSKIDWAMYMFVAKNCNLSRPQSLDGGEKIVLRPVTFDEFLKIIFAPNFRDFEVTLRVARILAAGEIETLKQLLFNK